MQRLCILNVKRYGWIMIALYMRTDGQTDRRMNGLNDDYRYYVFTKLQMKKKENFKCQSCIFFSMVKFKIHGIQKEMLIQSLEDESLWSLKFESILINNLCF